MIRKALLLFALGASCRQTVAFQPVLLSQARRTQSLRIKSTRVYSTTAALPRLSSDNLEKLKEQGYVVIEDFLPSDMQESLRNDVEKLRSVGKFKTAKIGQDSTNALNTGIRVAETCFLGKDKLADVPSESRTHLYSILDQVRADLSSSTGNPLDSQLTELLYAYYPQGGFYRRHRDAIPGSASVLRSFSLLLYLNKDWNTAQDKGELRMHFDSVGDELPTGEEPNYKDVEPLGGTLVLFKSDAVPHEVLDTQRERAAVIGWYNRPVNVSDIANLGEGGGSTQLILLGIAGALVTVGLVNLLSG